MTAGTYKMVLYQIPHFRSSYSNKTADISIQSQHIIRLAKLLDSIKISKFITKISFNYSARL